MWEPRSTSRFELADGFVHRSGRRTIRQVNGRGADTEGEIESVAQSIGEEELGCRKADIVFTNPQDLLPVGFAGINHIVLQMNRPLGLARRARAVEPETGVIGSRRRRFQLLGFARYEVRESRRTGRGCPIHHDDVLQKLGLILYFLDIAVEGRIDHQDSCSAVVEKIKVVFGAHEGVEADGDGADLDGSKECLGIYLGIEEEQCHSLFHSDIQALEGIAHLIHPHLDVGIGERTILTFHGNLATTAFSNVSIHKIIRCIEKFR